MKFFDMFSRLVKGRRNPKPERKSAMRPRRLPLSLELLEDRTLMSVAPPPILGTQSNLGAGISPMVLIDPTNPLQEVVVYTTPIVVAGTTLQEMRGQFSRDGGASWTAFGGGDDNLVDPNSAEFSNPVVRFTEASNPTVAFDRNENFYITYTEHDVAFTSGALVLQKYHFNTSGAPTHSISDEVLDRWFQIDPILNPVVAVDANAGGGGVPYTDPTTGATQADTMVGKAVYVAWNTDYKAPTLGNEGFQFNPNTIKVIASDDGGASFTTEQYVNNGHTSTDNINTFTFDPIHYPTDINGNPIVRHDATPKILFTQGTTTPTGGGTPVVAGGQLVFVWNDFGKNSVVSDTSTPDGGVLATPVAASATYTVSAPTSNNGAPSSTTVNITAASWAPAGGGTATVTLASPAVGDHATITNLTPAGFNVTNVPITTVSGTSFSYALGTNPTTTSVSGASATDNTSGTTAPVITAATWAGGVVTISAANTFTMGDSVTVTGVLVNGVTSGFDGTFTLLTAAPGRFTYALANSPYVATGNFSGGPGNAMASVTNNQTGTNAIIEAVDNGNDTNGNDIPDTVTPTVFTQTLTTPADANFNTVKDLDVTVNLVHPHLNQVSITLTAQKTGPGGFGPITVTLLNNQESSNGQSNGNVGVADNNPGINDPNAVVNGGLGEINRDSNNPAPHFETPGKNTGVTADLVYGAVFDQQAPRSIHDSLGLSSANYVYVAHFRPEDGGFNTGGLTAFNGLTAADLNGSVWTLTITDNVNDLESNTNDNPRQYLDNWSLHFTSRISTNGFGSDVTAATGAEPGSADAQLHPYATTSPVSPVEGIGPDIAVAQDNTLGSFSPYQGRLYVAYVGVGSTSSTPNRADNSDVFLVASNDGGQTWTALQNPVTQVGSAVRVNQDSGSDNFSQGNRPQFMPALTVDPVTGTLVSTFYDGRFDAAVARVTTTLVTSIDGGQTFSPDAYLNNTKTAVDAITGATVNLEPIPDNMKLAPAFAGTNLGFGTQMGLAVTGGRVTTIWSGNLNAAGASLLTDASPGLTGQQNPAPVTYTEITAGPRIVGSDMGPVIAPFVATYTGANDTATPSVGSAATSMININAPSPDDIIANVPGSVQVSVNITASDDSILHIYLVDPNGRTVNLVLANTGSGSNFGRLYADGTFGDTTFSDTGATLLTANGNTGPYLGTFKPSDSLDALAGLTANGAWTLHISATAGSFTLNNWSLAVKTYYNNQHATASTPNPSSPGERELDAFLVQFDRPIEISTLTTGQINVQYQNPNTGVISPVSVSSVTALDPVFFGPHQVGFFGSSRLATMFLVHFSTPQTAVGTYSYSVGPTGAGAGDIQDLVQSKTSSAVAANPGNFMDQNGNGKTDEPSSTGATPTLGDVYFAPNPTGVTPFTLPFDPNTLPLIIPGPYVASSDIGTQGAAVVAPPTGAASTVANVNLAVNAPVSFIDVVFDRVIQVASFMPAAVLRLLGPTGLVPLVDSNNNSLVTVTPLDATTLAGVMVATKFKVAFPTQTISGTYTLVLDPTVIKDSQGNKLDTNHNAGLDVLRFGALAQTANSQGVVTHTSNISTPIPVAMVVNGNTVPGKAESTVTFAENFLIQNATLSLFIQDPHDPDLTAQLVAPDGTVVTTLFINPPGNNSNQANFGSASQSTFFTDASAAPIDTGSAPYTNATGYDPQTPLAVLDGKSANQDGGIWTLRILNNSTANTGTLVHWSLNLTQTLPITNLGEPVADQATVGFRIFTQDPSNVQSSTTWTAVGPTADNATNNIGRITAMAVDPSDSSGNTVFAAAAGGGIWKTTNFLNTDVQRDALGNILYDSSHNAVPVGPTWIPLTDFGPEAGVNIGSIAAFAVNGDPKQTFIIAGTGEGPLGTKGVGFIVSRDGGATWTLIDSSNHNFFSDLITSASLPIASATRDHQFVGDATYKIVIDPNSPNGANLVIYAAMADGLWKSINSGATWTLLKAGVATDVVLVANSGVTGTPALLQTVWAAFQGAAGIGGVYRSTVAGTSGTFTLQNGAGNNANIQLGSSGSPVPVANPSVNPNSAGGRILLATPALLPASQTVANKLYQTWLYALALNPNGSLNGLYMTKDDGIVWTKVNLPHPVDPITGASLGNKPTNDETQPSYDATGPTGAAAAALAIDPTNPNIVYVGGSSTGALGGLIQVDTTRLQDANAFYAFDNSDNDGGLAQAATTSGGISVDSRVLDEVARKANPNSTKVLPTPFVNLEVNPNDPFATSFPVEVTVSPNLQFNNSGNDARFAPLDAAISSVQVAASDGFNNFLFPSSVFYQDILAVTDPLTQRTRLLLGTSRGIFDAVDTGTTDGTGTLINHLGTAQLGTGARTGNMQTIVFKSGAAQPSTLAAQIAGALFYGSTPSYGESIPYGTGSLQSVEGHGLPQSDPNVLQDGNLSWTPTFVNPVNSAIESIVAGAGVQTGAQGQGTLFQYKNPDTSDFGGQTSIFQLTTALGANPQDRTGTGGNTLFSAIGETSNPPSTDWPAFPGSNFAINPADPNGIVISSQLGRIFLTTDQGQTWIPKANPASPGYTLDNSYAAALAFGAEGQPTPQTIDNIIFVGTQAGHTYVTTTGGGNANWKQIAFPSVDGSPVMSISADPTPGTTDVYAVTQKGVYYLADFTVAAPVWVNITGNLAALTHNIFGNALLPETLLNPSNNPADPLNIAGSKFITSLATDWRVRLADNPTDPSTGLKHPVLYVGGAAGVFRSLDQGLTWTVFPSISNDGSPVDGGYLPVTPVVDLALSQGEAVPNSNSGVIDQTTTGQDVLLAMTAGRGAFAIRLASNEIQGPHVVSLLPTTPSATQNGPVSSVTVTFSTSIDPTTFTLNQAVQNESTSTDNGGSTTTAYAPLAHTPILPGTLAGVIYNGSLATNESTSTDNGSTTTAAYAPLGHFPILPGTMSGTIFDGATMVQTFTVSTTGVFTFTPIGAPATKVTAGSLNAATGQLTFIWNVTPGANHAVVSYQYNQPIQTFSVSSGGVFTFTPIGNPTVKATGGSLNLATGQLTFTWNSPPGANRAVVSYQYSDIVSFTDPNGTPITVTAITDIDPVTHKVYRLDFAPQNIAGAYALTLGPSIADFSGNQMNETQTETNGKPSDTYTGRFYLNSTATGPTASGLLFQNTNGTFNALASNGKTPPTATSGATTNAPFWDMFPPTAHWLYVNVGDFNGDGRSDYVGYLQETGQWWVTVTTGQAGIQSSSVWTTLSTSSSVVVKTLDVNGDGKTDLAIFDAANGKIIVLESTGSAFTTSTWATFTPTQAGLTWTDVLVGDFNGDKKDDLTFRWVEGGQIYVALSNGTSAFTNSLGTLFTGADANSWASVTGGAGIFADATVGDFNGDGKDDLAFLWVGGGIEYVGLSNGTAFTNNAGTALMVSQWDKFTPPKAGITYSNFTAADFNGDGKDDLLFRWDEGGQIYVAKSNGTAFTNNAGTAQSFSLWGSAPADSKASDIVDFNVGDFAGDGKTEDIIFRQASSGLVYVGLSSGTAFLGLGAASTSVAPPNVATFVDGNVGDFNKDGRTDYTLRWLQTGFWYVASNIGTRTANNTTIFDANALQVPWLAPTVTYDGVMSGDFNGDGLTDVVAFVPQTGQWFVSLSNGSGGYTTSVWTVWVVKDGETFSNFLVGDFNNDGRMDVAGFWDQGGIWYVNESTYDKPSMRNIFNTVAWTPAGQWTPVGSVHYANAHVGDFNDDGFADIEIQYVEGGQVYVMTSKEHFVTGVGLVSDHQFSPFVTLTTLNTSHKYSSPVIGAFDKNNPGRADFAIFDQDPTVNKWQVVLTQAPGGAVSADEPLTDAPYLGTTPAHPLMNVVVGNFTGATGANARNQIAGLDAVTGNIYVLVPTFSGITFTGFTSTVWDTIAPASSGAIFDSFVAGDMNGDGKDDLLFRWMQGGVVYVDTSNGSLFSRSQFGMLPPGESLNASSDPNTDDPGVVFLKDL